MTNPKSFYDSFHSRTMNTTLALAAALAAFGMPSPTLAQALTVTHIVPTMVAGAPPDSSSTPYNPATMSGRLDANTPLSPFAGVVSIAGGGSGVLIDSTHVLTAGHVIGSTSPGGMTVFVNYSGGQNVLDRITVGRRRRPVPGRHK